MKKEKMILLGALLVAFAVASIAPVMAAPGGASVVGSTTDNGQYPGSSVNSINIVSGHIYLANLTAEQPTYHWAGVYGNATGTLILGDGSNNKMFEWTAKADYVFFDNDSTVDWTAISSTDCTTMDSVFSWLSGASDSCANTFNESGSPSFKSISYSAGNTIYARTYDNTSALTWKTYALSDTANSDIIFAAETNTAGDNAYDGTIVNYQAILPENGNDGDTTATQYYVWLELY